jgi:hypothetical protein
MATLINTTYTCTLAGACHDGSAASAAGFNMMQSNWPKLVGSMPGGTTMGTPSICAKDPAYMNMPYIMKGSATGDGILLRKLMGPLCSAGGMNGVQMPNLGKTISAGDMPCFQAWVKMLANM